MARWRAPSAVLLCAICLGAAGRAQGLADPRPVLAVDAAAAWKDFETLASPTLEGRRTGTPGTAAARRLMVERFEQAGLVAPTGSFEMPFRFSRGGVDTDGINVVGLCRAPASGDERALVVSAHYDHVGIRDGVVYPGADDNASGVTGLLVIAGMCRKSPWTHDVLFVAFDAEEQGLRGARAFVAAPPILKSRIALNINMDMISRSATREIYVAGTAHAPWLTPVLEPVAARSKVTVRFGHDRPGPGARARDDWTMLSDHGAFHAAGIPFVYFGVEDHPDYHKPTDTVDRVDAAFFFQVMATVFDAVTTLDRSLPSPPR